ncbi:hypothetical protein ACFYXH_00180 [Streptomyces sp. NPDC002730]
MSWHRGAETRRREVQAELLASKGEHKEGEVEAASARERVQISGEII